MSSPNRSRQRRMAEGASARSNAKSMSSAPVPISCRRNSNWVTTLKFPPPPRRPQNRSSCCASLTCSVSPSAVTISYETTLSQARSIASRASPCLRRGSAHRLRCGRRFPPLSPSRPPGRPGPGRPAKRRLAPTPGGRRDLPGRRAGRTGRSASPRPARKYPRCCGLPQGRRSRGRSWGKVDGDRHISAAGASHRHRWAAVDHRVPHGTSRVIAVVAGQHHPPVQAALELAHVHSTGIADHLNSVTTIHSTPERVGRRVVLDFIQTDSAELLN